MSLFVRLKVENPNKTKISFNLAIMKDGELYHKVTGYENQLASPFIQGSCRIKFCTFEKLEDAFLNDKVTVVVNLTISTEEVVPIRNEDDDQVRYNTAEIDKTFIENMKVAFSHTNLSDFTVKCDDEKIPCHKVILASRSDVLRAMFCNETEEKKGNELVIKDASPDNVKGMMDYIYTGKIPDNIDDTCGDMLYLAAKYNLPELVKACEVALLNSLCEGNALATLVILDRHCPESLSRKDVIKFIVTNIEDIFDTEEWDKLGKDHFKLVTEIFKCSRANKAGLNIFF